MRAKPLISNSYAAAPCASRARVKLGQDQSGSRRFNDAVDKSCKWTARECQQWVESRHWHATFRRVTRSDLVRRPLKLLAALAVITGLIAGFVALSAGSMMGGALLQGDLRQDTLWLTFNIPTVCFGIRICTRDSA